MNKYIWISLLLFFSASIYSKSKTIMKIPLNTKIEVKEIFERIRSHNFNPLDEDNSMTMDRHLNVAGIADMNDGDWRVRLLAVRDLLRAGVPEIEIIKEGLTDQSAHVRQISAMALGILRADQAIEDLEYVIANDNNTMVRSQAVVLRFSS